MYKEEELGYCGDLEMETKKLIRMQQENKDNLELTKLFVGGL